MCVCVRALIMLKISSSFIHYRNGIICLRKANNNQHFLNWNNEFYYFFFHILLSFLFFLQFSSFGHNLERGIHYLSNVLNQVTKVSVYVYVPVVSNYVK